MIDLANFDKHGGHAKPSEQRSGRSPHLVNVRGALQITAEGGETRARGWTGIRVTPQGMQPFGSGKVAVVITGEIVDSDGRDIMALEVAETAAIEAWEALLARLGLASLTSNAQGEGYST